MTASAVVFGSGQAQRLSGSVVEHISNGDNDFDTFHPDEWSSLDASPEEAGELADTDNYRGFSDRAVVQELEEHLANNDLAIPADLETEYQTAVEGMSQLKLLQEYEARIAKRGIGIPDVASIESHFPGLLSNAPTSFSYRPSQVNKEFSQEAIADKINAIKGRGREILKKLIKWIREQCAKIKKTFTRERFKAAAKKVEQVEQQSQSNFYTVNEVLDKLDNVDEYDQHPIVLKLGEVVDHPIKLEMFTSTKPGKTAWAKHLNNYVGDHPKPLVSTYVANAIIGKLEEITETTFQHADSIGTNQAVGSRANSEEHVNEWVSAINNKAPDMAEILHSATHGDLVTGIISSITKIESMITQLERQSGKADDAQKELGTDAKDMLELMNEVVSYYRQCLSNSLVVVSWVTFSLNFITRNNVEYILKQRQGDNEDPSKVVMETLDQITLLQRYQKRFSTRGVGLADVVSVESHFPGLLSTDAPVRYTRHSSAVNAEYSQEALGDEIKRLLVKGKQALDKMIAWILERCGKLKQRYTDSRIKANINRFNTWRKSDHDNLTVPQIMQVLGNDVSSYDGNGIVDAMSNLTKKEITLSLFKDVKTADPYNWTQSLGDLGWDAPPLLMAGRDMRRTKEQLMGNLRRTLVQLDNGMSMAKAVSGNDDYENIRQEIGNKQRTDGSSLVTAVKFMTDGSMLTDLVSDITEMEKITMSFKVRLDKEWRELDKSEDVTAAKQERAAAHDILRTISGIANDLSQSISSGLLILQWATYSSMYTTKGNIMKIKNSDHEHRD